MHISMSIAWCNDDDDENDDGGGGGGRQAVEIAMAMATTVQF